MMAAIVTYWLMTSAITADYGWVDDLQPANVVVIKADREKVRR